MRATVINDVNAPNADAVLVLVHPSRRNEVVAKLQAAGIECVEHERDEDGFPSQSVRPIVLVSG